MNLAYRWPLAYWNTACLITDTGGLEVKEEGNSDRSYDKLARGIGKMQNAGVRVALPDINKSALTFKPDVANNSVLYGLKGIPGVGDDIIKTIITYRPYTSVQDFIDKVKPDKSAMISLIKSGAFDSFGDRKQIMVDYLHTTCGTRKTVNITIIPKLYEKNIISDDTEELKKSHRIYEFNRYLKNVCGKKDNCYTLDERAMNFLIELGMGFYPDGEMPVKDWEKYYTKAMEPYRIWLKDHEEECINILNEDSFKEEYKKYTGRDNISAWEIDACGFYYHEHELTHVNNAKYGIVNFFDLPSEPVITSSFETKEGRTIHKYQLGLIAGTVVAKDKNHATITLSTPSGVVDVKFNKEFFAMFNRKISQVVNGKKVTIDPSYFDKGNLLLLSGFRQGDTFVAKKYVDSINRHQLYRITNILPNGSLELQGERLLGMGEDE